MTSIRTKFVTAAAVAAAAVGGATFANAATSTTPTPTTSAASTAAPTTQNQHDPSQGGHQANGKTETLLTGTTADKVKAAALAKLPGGTVERVETDADSTNPYEAHVTKADGTQVEVVVDANYKVVAVNTMGGQR